MKIDTNAWKTEKWSVHPETPHAIMIPGWGWYGGLPEDVAQAIVDAMKMWQSFEEAVGL